MSDERKTDPAPAPSSESQQMRALRPLETVIRDMSERVFTLSERLSEERAAVAEIARELRDVGVGLRMLREELRDHQKTEEREFEAIAKRFEVLERQLKNGAASEAT